MKTNRRTFLGAALAFPSLCATNLSAQERNASEEPWDLKAQVVVVGAGACGLVAALKAAEAGLDVLVVDTNYDAGGHAILSGGTMTLGGGTAQQKKYGIKDDPETFFKDLTDWSVTEADGTPDYRFNDRDVQHAIAYHGAPTYDFLAAHGVGFVDEAPDNMFVNHANGISAPRAHHVMWDKKGTFCLEGPGARVSTALVRPLEKAARDRGVRFLFNYHMDELVRESPRAGRITGIVAHYTPVEIPGKGQLSSWLNKGNISSNKPNVRIEATKAVVVATGGSVGNVEFRRIFDPRMTEEVQCPGTEFSPQDASGEKAAMAIGASLWGTANQTNNRFYGPHCCYYIGTKTGYATWHPDAPIWGKVKATGLFVTNWQNCIMVNQAGKRFYNELKRTYLEGSSFGFYDDKGGYRHGDWRNPSKNKPQFQNYIDAALAINEGSQAPNWSAGPQWAIFDSAAVKREHWKINPTSVQEGYFFVADTLDELQALLNKNEYQKFVLPPNRLKETVARYN